MTRIKFDFEQVLGLACIASFLWFFFAAKRHVMVGGVGDSKVVFAVLILAFSSGALALYQILKKRHQ